MRLRSVILDTTVRLVFDAALVLSVYMLFAGHNQPGGGFVGGLVAGAAIGLRYVAGGLDEALAVVPVRPSLLPAVGLALAVGTALWPLAGDEPPLDHRVLEWHLPVLGEVALATATIFDAGVYLIVVGLVLMVLDGLGREGDEEAEGG
ncbi:MAG: MnhB domain-containing protein [Thermoanaerobacterales bacterium]